MIRLLDDQARLALSLLEDYLARIEYEMEGEIIWEDRPYAERVDQAIVDTKLITAALEEKIARAQCDALGDKVALAIARAEGDLEEDSNVILCPDCGKRHHHRYCEKE